MSDEMHVTTTDMLEIVASGGNGAEYVDYMGLMGQAAKELREMDAEIERLRKYESIVKRIANDWVELSHDKILLQRDDYRRWCSEAIAEDRSSHINRLAREVSERDKDALRQMEDDANG